MTDVQTLYDQHGGDMKEIAAALGVPFQQEMKDTPAPRRRVPPADLGASLRPDRKYIVSRRHADNPVWPREDQRKIEDARALYEAGTHEMITGRDRDWFILYSIPRQIRAETRKFFQPS
jgi:hypothetical protein